MHEKIAETFTQRVLQDVDLWSHEKLRHELEFAGRRLLDLGHSHVGFFATVIAEPVILGNAFLLKISSIDQSDVMFSKVNIHDIDPPSVQTTRGEQKEKPLCLLITGAENPPLKSSGTPSNRLSGIVDSVRRILEYRDEFLVPHAARGAFLLLPPNVANLPSAPFRREDLGELIELPEDDSIMLRVRDHLLRSVSRHSRADLPNLLDPASSPGLLAGSSTEPVLTWHLLLQRLDSAKRQSSPQRLTKEMTKTVRESIRQVAILDKKSYPRKRALADEITRMPLADFRPVLIEELRASMQSFEKEFEADLRQVLGEGGLDLQGENGSYNVPLPSTSFSVRISVESPYNAVRVGERLVPNPFPRGVLEEVNAVRQSIVDGKPFKVPSEDIAQFIAGVLDATSAASGVEDVLVDTVIESATALLEEQGFRRLDERGRPLAEVVRERASEQSVLSKLEILGWISHTGKSGGVVSDGRRYTVFTRRK